MLTKHLQTVQRLIGFDVHQELYSLDTLIDFVNIARGEVASQGQCIRRETPSAGQIVRIQVVSPGVGYTAPKVIIPPPDQPKGALPYPKGAQATAVAQQIGGSITDVGMTFGGDGYYAPSATIADPTGSGAVLAAFTNTVNTTTAGQELYRFSDIDITGMAGVKSILAVISVSFVWGNWQWSASRCSNSYYMALIRQFTTNYLAPPTWCCQYGQGVDGSLKLYPIPDQNYPMIWDCLCLPSDVYSDGDTEAIPDPWTGAVPYYAAHLALLSKSAQIPQLKGLADSYFNEKTGGLFTTMMKRARAFSQPGYTSSFYGRV